MRIRNVVIAALAVLLGVGTVACTASNDAADDSSETSEEQTVDDQSSEGDEKAVVQEKNVSIVTMAEAPALTSTTEAGLTVTAPEAFLATDELAAVETEISQLEADGYQVCVSLVDLETRRGITYEPDVSMYPASCIKALFCTWLYETYGGAGDMSAVVENCIVNSSNDAYSSLIDTYGISSFLSWLSTHGGPTYESSGLQHYPNMTAAQLEAAWEEVYRFCSSEEEGASELAGYLSQTTTSPIASVLRGTHTVWSKAGWYPTDEYDLSTSNDAGVVFSETGDYVLVIMTDIGADLDALEPLISALDAAHETMCGDALAYYE